MSVCKSSRSSFWKRLVYVFACPPEHGLPPVNLALNNLDMVESGLARALEKKRASPGEVLDLRDHLLSAEEWVSQEMRARSEAAWERALLCAGESCPPMTRRAGPAGIASDGKPAQN
jgi:hypothetical protein